MWRKSLYGWETGKRDSESRRNWKKKRWFGEEGKLLGGSKSQYSTVMVQIFIFLLFFFYFWIVMFYF
ncbi:Uncharacterized protein TCM_044392 [Theobroma cacao]|uniref:Uncharacterized protein n=1 Tax=Theobroma cacao TaxID=3641 RepID=A0A061FPT9_THECC|nr:Uncharacterized protein TCM_044392 [Theobroma cacao]